MKNWAEFLFRFYTDLRPPELPQGVSWLDPLREEPTQNILREFLQKFYCDKEERTLLLGINPGRFGAGITGVNFTAPKQLKDYCHIDTLLKGSELSAEFIYKMISEYGGVEKFYSAFFIGSVCPLGLVEDGKNLNYYDKKEMLETLEPFIVDNLSKLISFKVNRKTCICIGGEKNFKFLSLLNKKHDWFDRIVTVPHPRFIMQYKRKLLPEYINLYLDVLGRK